MVMVAFQKGKLLSACVYQTSTFVTFAYILLVKQVRAKSKIGIEKTTKVYGYQWVWLTGTHCLTIYHLSNKDRLEKMKV